MVRRVLTGFVKYVEEEFALKYESNSEWFLGKG
jgi:hypothetical protein